MNSTHLHQNNSHTSITSWKQFATAAVATAALGVIPAGTAAATTAAATPVAAVVAPGTPPDHDNTMQQQSRHDRQRDQRQDRRAETTIGDQILAGWHSSSTPM
ncbi:hypothetical protein I1A62_09490 [Rhodococcus sp. USK10]|uniref:Uncharacterized protein n=1 Tax=Rhodococcus wratislaviensis TaxID=44752 RepID=A0A402CMY8_RHOWR|nr:MULTISPECIES: hypothetical protein [Rhodococcus]QYB04663.1 hypothetical protein I1A62_09490 [Rhodococcus sp. USK10]GCE45000.1 hypothetical protein Rhow_000960 [Rhodococcus wratislaviensis]